MAQHAVSVMPQTHGRLVRRAVLSNGMWSTSGLHRGLPSATRPISVYQPGDSRAAPALHAPCWSHVTAQRPALPPAHQALPRPAPHLLGLSLRLVLRARKLSFSGVSSKDRRTLERRPCQGGADLSWNWGNWPLKHPHASSPRTYQPHPDMLPTRDKLQVWDSRGSSCPHAHKCVPVGQAQQSKFLGIVSIVANNARPLSPSTTLLQPWTADSKASPSPNAGLPS